MEPDFSPSLLTVRAPDGAHLVFVQLDVLARASFELVEARLLVELGLGFGFDGGSVQQRNHVRRCTSEDDDGRGHVEGFGIVYLEAAARGVPSVGTQTGGIPEAVEDGETGVLVPPNSPDALAEAMIELLTDVDRRRRLGARASERAQSHFSWNTQVDRLHEWLVGSDREDKVGGRIKSSFACEQYNSH